MNKFKDRKSSSIYNIRVFHNWVKNELIKQTVNYLKTNYHINKISLLDLSSGRGGDMHKWLNNNIMFVVGFDIDGESIKEAYRRYQQMINDLKRKNLTIPNYYFYTMDLSDKNNLVKISNILKEQKFNIVSCQFAIHYFFRTEETLDTFIKIVSSYLEKDGFFIGTTMNGNKLMTLEKKIGNDLFNIEKVTEELDYGSKYLVSLGKEGDKEHYFVDRVSEEYIVNIDVLKKMCEKYGMMFIGTTDFEKWYEIFGKDLLSEEEKEFSFLNFSFVFKKI